MAEKETCASCRFSGYGDNGLECRFMPPVLVRTESGRGLDLYKTWSFPEVDHNEWCGQHKPSEEESQ